MDVADVVVVLLRLSPHLHRHFPHHPPFKNLITTMAAAATAAAAAAGAQTAAAAIHTAANC